MPSAKIRENKTIVLSVTPKALRMIKDKNIDSGMAIPTNKALRKPKKNINTPTTKIIPKIMLFSRSETCVIVLSDISLVLDMTRFGGNTFAFALAIISSIFLEAFIKFSPPRFFTSSITTALLYWRA